MAERGVDHAPRAERTRADVQSDAEVMSPQERRAQIDAFRGMLAGHPLSIDALRNAMSDTDEEIVREGLERFLQNDLDVLEQHRSGSEQELQILFVAEHLSALSEAGVAMTKSEWAEVCRFKERFEKILLWHSPNSSYVRRVIDRSKKEFADAQTWFAPVKESVQSTEGRHKLKLLLYEAEPRIPQLERAIAALPEEDAIAEMEAFVKDRVVRYGDQYRSEEWKKLHQVMELCATLMDVGNALSPRVRTVAERLHGLAETRLEELENGPSDRLIALLELHPMPLEDVLRRIGTLSDPQIGQAFWVFTNRAMERLRKGDEASYGRATAALDALAWHGDILATEIKVHITHAQKRLANEKESADEITEQRRKEAEQKQQELAAMSPEQQRYEVKEALRENPISTERVCEAITLMENSIVNAEFIGWSARVQRIFEQHAFPDDMRKAADAITALSAIANQLPLLSWEAIGAAAGRMRKAMPWVMDKDRTPYDQAMSAFEDAKTSAPEILALGRYVETEAPLQIDDVVQDLHAMPSNAAAQDALNRLVEKASNALVNDEQEYFARTLGMFTALAERRTSFLATEQECIEQGVVKLVQEKRYDNDWRRERAEQNRANLQTFVQNYHQFSPEKFKEIIADLPSDQVFDEFAALVGRVTEGELRKEFFPVSSMLGAVMKALPGSQLGERIAALRERMIDARRAERGMSSLAEERAEKLAAEEKRARVTTEAEKSQERFRKFFVDQLTQEEVNPDASYIRRMIATLPEQTVRDELTTFADRAIEKGKDEIVRALQRMIAIRPYMPDDELAQYTDALQVHLSNSWEAFALKESTKEKAPSREAKLAVRLREAGFGAVLSMLVRECGERWYANAELEGAAREGIARLLNERTLSVDKIEGIARACGFTGDALTAVMLVPKKAIAKRKAAKK